MPQRVGTQIRPNDTGTLIFEENVVSWITKDRQTYYGIEMTKDQADELTERINHLNEANFKMEQAKETYEDAKEHLEEYLAELQKPSRRKSRAKKEDTNV